MAQPCSNSINIQLPRGKAFFVYKRVAARRTARYHAVSAGVWTPPYRPPRPGAPRLARASLSLHFEVYDEGVPTTGAVEPGLEHRRARRGVERPQHAADHQ